MKKCLFLCYWLCSVSMAVWSQSKGNKPNIIFILADDLGYADLQCYGQTKIATPFIDALAAGGMKFTQFYSSSTVCAPARASFMTGLHTGHTVIRGNKSFEPEGQTPLPDSVLTLANHLQQIGYRTAAFGKWGLGYITTSGDPNKKGFDLFYGYNCQSLAHDYYPDHLWKNHQKIDLSFNGVKDSVYSADLIHQQAIQFLQTQKHQQPFFLYLPYTLPHGDVIAVKDAIYWNYVKQFNEAPLEARPKSFNTTNRSFEPYPHAAFAAMVTRLDRYVGEVVTTLKEKKLLDNTLIVFSSDNGPHRENGGDPEFFNNNGIYRGIKRDLYEGGIRVPMIAYWNNHIPAATTNQQPAVLHDLFPTFLELAGISKMPATDGISLLSVFSGKSKPKVHDYLYWEFHENQGRQAIRWKQWKGILLQVNRVDAPAMELYDIENDPAETKNIASQYPEIVKTLQGLVKNAHVSNPDWPLLPSEKK